MGTTFKRGERWGINYIDPNGLQVRKLISPYRETAEKVLKKIETEIAEGKYLDRRQEKKVLFEDLAAEYVNTYVRLENQKSFGVHECLIKTLKNHFRDKYLHQIDSLTIRQFLSKRLGEVKASTVNRHLTMLKSMFNRAIEWGMLTSSNPANGIKKMPENNCRCRWLSEQEQEKLLSHCRGLIRVMVIVALKTGMRWGEIKNLKWNQGPESNYIDFDNGMILIHEALAKTDKSRQIPLSNAVRLALKEVPRIKWCGFIRCPEIAWTFNAHDDPTLCSPQDGHPQRSY